jgi:hypothetical protein
LPWSESIEQGCLGGSEELLSHHTPEGPIRFHLPGFVDAASVRPWYAGGEVARAVELG